MPAAALAYFHWRPNADVVETVGAITVTVELAGVDEEDVAVVLFEDVLVVEGRRELPRCEGDGVYHVAAIRQGRSGSWCRWPSAGRSLSTAHAAAMRSARRGMS